MNIREIKAADIHFLIGASYDLHQESSFRDMDFNPKKVASTLGYHLSRPKTHCGYLAEHEGEIIGMMVAKVTETFFGGDLVANDQVFYVFPESRGGKAAYLLLNMYVDWALSKNVKRIYLGSTTGIKQEAFVRLAERLGFTDNGVLMSLRA